MSSRAALAVGHAGSATAAAADTRARLVAAREAFAAAEQELATAVEAAREQSQSWADIGSAVGITKQAAWKRWSR